MTSIWLVSALFFTGCLCSEPPPESTETAVLPPPVVVSFTSDKNRLASDETATLTAQVAAPSEVPYYLEWASSCGTVIPLPEPGNTARFRAPYGKGACRVSVRATYDVPLEATERSLDIQIDPPLEKEIIR
ncbi:MAG: hypothetical protein JXX29_06435 [Deltaproteobacteria bacterium]|nr:hypothetical protein [Deltaproteobacteria bacterium]MBN2671289.1 hypothetical protein [Deltaproteobacteria bacterium]